MEGLFGSFSEIVELVGSLEGPLKILRIFRSQKTLQMYFLTKLYKFLCLLLSLHSLGNTDLEITQPTFLIAPHTFSINLQTKQTTLIQRNNLINSKRHYPDNIILATEKMGVWI